MSIYIAYLAVFLLAATPFLEVVGVIPIGVAAGLSALPVTVIAFSGNILTIWLVILMMERVKAWLQKHNDKKGNVASEKRGKRASDIWKRYGLPGLAIVSPILVGSHLGVILAMSFGGKRKQITFWMTFSVLAWAVVIGIASYFGIDFLFSQTGSEGFLTNLLETK